MEEPWSKYSSVEALLEHVSAMNAHYRWDLVKSSAKQSVADKLAKRATKSPRSEASFACLHESPIVSPLRDFNALSELPLSVTARRRRRIPRTPESEQGSPQKVFDPQTPISESTQSPSPDDFPLCSSFHSSPDFFDHENDDVPSSPEVNENDEDVPSSPEVNNDENDVPNSPEVNNVDDEDVPSSPEVNDDDDDVPNSPEVNENDDDVPNSPEVNDDDDDVPNSPEVNNDDDEDVPNSPEVNDDDDDVPNSPEVNDDDDDVPTTPLAPPRTPCAAFTPQQQSTVKKSNAFLSLLSASKSSTPMQPALLQPTPTMSARKQLLLLSARKGGIKKADEISDSEEEQGDDNNDDDKTVNKRKDLSGEDSEEEVLFVSDDDDDERSNPPQLSSSGRSFSRAYTRESVTQRLLSQFNESVFDGKLASVPVVWSVRLRTTAGQTRLFTEKLSKRRKAVVELSTKVLDDDEKLKLTLLHELCHAAAWLIDGSSNPPHGKVFWQWAELSMERTGLIVTRCHSYQINYKHNYACSNPACTVVIGRHSKSLDVNKYVCSRCNSKLEYVGGKPAK